MQGWAFALHAAYLGGQRLDPPASHYVSSIQEQILSAYSVIIPKTHQVWPKNITKKFYGLLWLILISASNEGGHLPSSDRKYIFKCNHEKHIKHLFLVELFTITMYEGRQSWDDLTFRKVFILWLVFILKDKSYNSQEK